ncbi:MAG: hypothetical protein IPN53_18315 [Comamonadaceae bacterium]|nr:hypothetical protein [Comamonadaceae bacterium]
MNLAEFLACDGYDLQDDVLWMRKAVPSQCAPAHRLSFDLKTIAVCTDGIKAAGRFDYKSSVVRGSQWLGGSRPLIQ